MAHVSSPRQRLTLPRASVGSNCVDWCPFQQKSFDPIKRPVYARK